MELCETDCLDEDIYDICDIDEGECSGSTPINVTDTNFVLQSVNDESSFVNGQADSLRNKFSTNFRNLESNKSDSGRPNGSTNASPSQRRIITTKQRSFTTSILVSPLADRKFHAILPSNCDSRNVSLFTDHRKTAEISRSYQRLYSGDESPCLKNKEYERKETVPLEISKSFEEDKQNELSESVKRTLCSGEVVVDIKKVNFYFVFYERL